MTSIEISRVTAANIELLVDIGRQIFYESFAGANTPEVPAEQIRLAFQIFEQ